MQFRLIAAFLPSRLLRVDGTGKLEGILAPLVYEASPYLFSKLNMTTIPPDEDVLTTVGIFNAGVQKLAQDKADIALNLLQLDYGLPDNVTVGHMIHEAQCKLASSPAINSAVLQDGPEMALKQFSWELLFLILIELLLLVYFDQIVLNCGNIFHSIWTLFAGLLRQFSSSKMKRPSKLVLILSILLIQILYGSFLHTERTSISSFIPIDSFEDIDKHNVTTFVPDISACQKLTGHEDKLIVGSMARAFAKGDVNGQNLRPCYGSGRCAALVNDHQRNIALSLACTLVPKRLIESPVYISPTLGRLYSAYAFNKRIPKDQRERIIGYAQRSFEMGLQEKDPLSKDFGTKTAKALTQSNANEECMSKTIQKSISASASLSNEFFRNCFSLYFSIVLISVVLFLLPTAKCDVQMNQR